MTFEQDHQDLIRHEREIAAHESFNYCILDDDESKLLGCVYIDPPEARTPEGVDAEVCWWVVDDLAGTEFEERLDAFVPRWINERWPFSNPQIGVPTVFDDAAERVGGIVVRIAGIDDAEPLYDLYVELANGRSDALPAGPDQIREILVLIASDPDRRILLAEVDGAEIAGTVDLMIVPNLTHGGSPWAVVENVVVAKAHRRRGVGRILLQEAIGHAKDEGCYKVQLISAKHRTEAHAFYRSLGFEAVGEGFKLYME
jgi:ribosomal protein S18 acetylase RimI-like enzyme